MRQDFRLGKIIAGYRWQCQSLGYYRYCGSIMVGRVPHNCRPGPYTYRSGMSHCGGCGAAWVASYALARLGGWSVDVKP